MHSSQTRSASRILAWSHFHHVGSLLKQMSEPETFMLTESSLEGSVKLAECFVVVVSPDFSALLQGNSVSSSIESLCQMQLAFAPEAIEAFLVALNAHLPEQSPLRESIAQAKFSLQPNDAHRQSDFTLQLIEVLSTTADVERLHDAPSKHALRQQVEQERLLNEVTSLIRHSLELPALLEMAVQRVRHFLQVDRLIIYQFNIPAPYCSLNVEDALPAEIPIPNLDGITYESRSSEVVPSVLHLMKEYSETSPQRLWSVDRDGFTWSIEDCQTSPSKTLHLLKLPLQAEVRAELVTPIVVQEELWGLLIAHQCSAPRQWQASEQFFLHRIAEHLAIAIYQSNIYSELQSQKLTLEQKVIERTQALCDTLVAAQSASRAKSEFLATMSHELRTPLTTIIGMAATLLRYHGNPKAPQALTLQKQQDYLHTIQSRGEQLLALINDILDLSQVEAGKTVLKVEEFSLTQMARQLIKTLQERADAKHVKLNLNLHHGLERDLHLDLRFQADPHRVQQILLNLLSNAIKFTPEHGQVTLRIWVHGNAAVLQVQDTGIGISDEQRSLLFQKFQQLDASYHRKYEGTGLGLALTKQLVELHGGSIEVESAVGVGSTFTVHLPEQVLSAIEHSREHRTMAVSPLHSRIVLIENHEETATLICDLLTAADYQVVWMMEGSAALRQIEMLKPAVVIVDIEPPNTIGIEVVRHLRQDLATEDIRILALISQSSSQGLDARIEDYVLKPITQPEQLIDKVTRLIMRKS
jgi:two-component system sensor histidine kinase/response regulator